MSDISNTLEENLALQGREQDSGLISLTRGSASKNITLSDWDQLVQGAAISAADLVRLYNLLGTIIPKIDGSITSNESSIASNKDRIEAIEADIGEIDDKTTVAALIGALRKDVGDVKEGENLASLISALQTIINSFYEKTQDTKIQISADTAQVVKADGTPSVTINGDTGTVTASTLVSSSGVISSILTVGSLISNSGVLAQLVQTPNISSGSSSTLDIQRKVIGILVNIAVNIFGSLKVTKVGQEGALTESITEIDGGNVTASGNVSVGSVKTSTILPMDDSNVITLGAVPSDDPTAVDTVKVEGNLDVTGNLDVGGNLNLKGKPIAQNMETLLVKDNIIVTNSSGAGFSFSGIVMRTSPLDPNNPNSPTQAYGILYSPITKAVMIGEGKLEEITDATTGAVTYEFDYYVGKSHPLAARSGFNNIKDGYIPVWDADLYAFVPSDKTAESIATQGFVESYVTGQLSERLSDLAEFLRKVNEGGLV
jgi:hypothetical protein